MKQTLKYVGIFLLSAAIAFAGSIKVWGTHDVLTASDLNANFQHIHNTMVGGHGARLVDADVAGNAAIQYTKVTTNPLTPTAWGRFSAACTPDGGTCALSDEEGVTSVVRVTGFRYLVTLTNPGAGAVLVTGGTVPSASTITPAKCHGNNPASTPLSIGCDTDFDQDGVGSPTVDFVVFTH